VKAQARRVSRALLTLGLLLAFQAHSAAASTVETEAVFERFSASVVRIQVVETGSGAKAVVGSGFFATPTGHILTNYHVVSKLVHHPDRYRAEYLRGDEAPVTLEVRAIDVVHDLAVVQGEEVRPPLSTDPVTVEKGTRLYALGHPRDLGLSIVEGTYNGHLDHMLYEKIHFTGSLNPGMSGGPTITQDGRVVGVNVSTAGNQVSFLVPVERARGLLDEVTRQDYKAPDNFLEVIRRQLLAHQDAYFATILAGPLPTAVFGDFRLPGKIAPFFNCWGDARRDEDKPFEFVNHECSTEDEVYVGPDQSSGVVRYQHQLLTSKELNRFQFYSLYSRYFTAHYGPFFGNEEEVTRFVCENDSVTNGRGVLRMAFCVRAYKKFPGLYDAVVKAAVLGSSDAGVVTSLAVAGVSFENAKRLASRYVEAIGWKE
jgi:serine protease Do